MRETVRRLVFFNATPGCRVHPDERCRPVRKNAPPPSGEVRVPFYGRHRLFRFSELARDTAATHTLTHTRYTSRVPRQKYACNSLVPTDTIEQRPSVIFALIV